MSKFFTIDSSDLIKGAIVTALAAALGAIQQALTGDGLNVVAYDWAGILMLSANAGWAYLLKNFFSDSSGAFIGVKSN